MKRMNKRLSALFCILMISSFLFAEGVTVPDLETRIRNGGNVVPDAALPVIASPTPAAVPDIVGFSAPRAAPATVVAAPVPVEAPPQVPTAAETPVAPPVPGPIEPPLSASIELGIGSPDSVRGELSLGKASGRLPGFGVRVLRDSADGYGALSTGDGAFDRETSLGVRVFADQPESGWFADIGLSERSDGLQGNNAGYFSLSRRDVAFKGGIDTVPLPVAGLSLSASIDGSVFSFFPDAPSPVTGRAWIANYGGYALSPLVSLAYAKGDFMTSLSGRYRYETVTGQDEFHDGDGTFAMRYTTSRLSLSASVSAAGDTEDGALALPNLGISWGDSRGIIRNVSLSGGLVRDRYSARLLADAEPFVALDGHSVYSADWMASGGLTFSLVECVSLDARAEIRKTAFGRGVLVLTDELDQSSRIPFARKNRTSLVTAVSVTGSGDWMKITAGYSGEWMDRLYRRVLHRVDAGLTVFDPDTARFWEAGVNSSFALDFADIPVISCVGTVRPMQKLAVSLSLDDVLPRSLGKSRTRNGLYREQSGEITLSARMDL